MKNIKYILLFIISLCVFSYAYASPPSGYTTIAKTNPKCAEVGFCGETSCIIVGGNACAINGYFLTLNPKPELEVDFAGYAKQGYDISKCRYKTTEYIPGSGQAVTTTNMSALAATGQTNQNFIGSIVLPGGYSNLVNNSIQSFKNGFGGTSQTAYNIWQKSNCPMPISAETASQIKQANFQTCQVASAYVVCPNPTQVNNAIPSVIAPANVPAQSVQTPPALPSVQNTYNNQIVPSYCRSPKC